MGDGNDRDLEYVIQTLEVDPSDLEKLDTKMRSREKDGHTVKVPSQQNVCPIQLWEVYFMVGILSLQPPSTVILQHVKALCEHSEPGYLCEAVLKEHVSGLVTDVSQETTWYTFFEEFMLRKFGLHFSKSSLLRYATDVLDDPLCGKDRTPRTFLAAPHVQAMMINTQYFEGQYEELISSMRHCGLPVFDTIAEPENEIGEAVGLDWDLVKLYDDPNLILKKYGGWATTKGHRMLTPKDQLIMRLTGMSLEQILTQPAEVPDSPRHEEDGAPSDHGSTNARRTEKKLMAVDDNSSNASEDSSHPSDFDIDPEHSKVMPLGVTVCEAFCLLRGLLVGEEGGWPRCVVSEQISRHALDGHPLAAAVLIDLYMRDQVEVQHWTISEGSMAVPYKMIRKKGRAPMDHFLDLYVKDCEPIFRDMRLPWETGDYPIWRSLEKRGIIDNHRWSYKRSGCFLRRVEVWDLARPDLILDFKAAYLTAARLLYDKSFAENVQDEVANDTLMFLYVLQNVFDLSFECIDGMARVLNRRCPPFQKGELFPPLSMVHAGTVCLGIADRAFRVATHQDTQLAQEAADFNELIMERFEHKFFLSPLVWESFDVDGSGELTLEEFVNGMQNLDLYKEFRKERIPDGVLRMIVADLAEKLFSEVDVNGDGTLAEEELASAFRRRRQEALKDQDRRHWIRTAVRTVTEQIGGKKSKTEGQDKRSTALRQRDNVQKKSQLDESRRQRELRAEVDRPHLPDEYVDVDAPLVMRDV